MTKPDITPGPWEIWPDDTLWCVCPDNDKIPSVPIGHDFTEGDAKLIAEAGTVYHETGLTPRQLLQKLQQVEKQRDELAGALDEIADIARIEEALSTSPGVAKLMEKAIDLAKSALANVEGGE